MKLSKQRLREIIKEEVEAMSADPEGSMGKSQMLKSKEYAEKITSVLDDDTQLPAWVQSKLTIASKNLSDVWHYIDGQMRDPDNQEDDRWAAIERGVAPE